MTEIKTGVYYQSFGGNIWKLKYVNKHGICLTPLRPSKKHPSSEVHVRFGLFPQLFTPISKLKVKLLYED